MMESISVVGCIRTHENACTKEAEGEPCGGRGLLYSPMYVLEGSRMVNRDL